MPGRTRSIFAPLCERLLETHASDLPDLGNIQIIVPSTNASTSLRLALLDAMPGSAIIPPGCSTLRSWIDRQVPRDPRLTVLSESQRLLLFTEALDQHPDLFQRENKWQVATALLQLFDELWMHRVSLPSAAADWQQLLKSAYQTEFVNRHMSQEATLVHTLWLAWQQQLAEDNMVDPLQDYAQRLALAPDHIDATHVYLTTTDVSPVEQNLIDRLLADGKATLADPVEEPSADRPNRTFIDACFDTGEQQLLERAATLADAHRPDIALYRSSGIDAEIAAIRLQLHSWLAEGKQRIAVICEDRKLSRRLRAVLDSKGIALQDDAGWYLSTTSAASVIERWLECIETDFDQRPLLDLLKSGFALPDMTGEESESVFRFERDIVRHENVSKNLRQYRSHLERRAERLVERLHWPVDSYRQLDDLLQRLQSAAAELVLLHGRQQSLPASQWLQACLESLSQIGVPEALLADDAGLQVMQKLDALQRDATVCTSEFNWRDFRYFLSSQLEQDLFRPAATGSGICLMTLEQARQQDFDAVIFAAAESSTLPGSMPASPFFNQAVRASLSLTDWTSFRAQRERNFRQALYADIPYLITCRRDNDGDPVQPSPWIDALQQFYRLCFSQEMETRVFDEHMDDDLVTDGEIQQQASIALTAERIPERISTSSHQRLIDCPYRFFAADVLGLRTAEEIATELRKPDYGERVHYALQAFHSQLDDLPAPFTQPITALNKDEAIARLHEISVKVFENDMEENALHRGWLDRWQRHIPAYVNWQMRHQQDWTVSATEQRDERALDDRHTLYGRLDRIDVAQDGSGAEVIDYKTGDAPKLADVLSGEDVQLSSYAMLLDGTAQVTYLELDKKDGAVAARTSLAGEELDEVREQATERLLSLLNRMREGGELIAQGDDKTCSYCEFSGLCRRAHWPDD